VLEIINLVAEDRYRPNNRDLPAVVPVVAGDRYNPNSRIEEALPLGFWRAIEAARAAAAVRIGRRSAARVVARCGRRVA
jgi:hypothetical protein